MKTKILTTILSLSLFMGTVSADSMCTGDHCMIHLPKLSPKTKEVNNVEYKGHSFKSKNLENIEENAIDDAYVLEEGTSFTMNENGVETIIFPHEKYVMTEVEIATYESEYIEQLNPLPKSEYFCGNDTKPVYNNSSDAYECA